MDNDMVDGSDPSEAPALEPDASDIDRVDAHARSRHGAGRDGRDDGRAAAIQQLRSARRRNRIARIDKFDAFYKAYVTGLFGAVAVYVAASLLGDGPVSSGMLDDIERSGPAWLGGAVAIAIAIGARSGGRGGPLAFERADVRHLLMAPVARRMLIVQPAKRFLRHGLVVGAAVGAAVGVVAIRRLPETPGLWVVSGALFGCLLVSGAIGTAMILGGRRAPSYAADVVGTLVIVWWLADLFYGPPISPFSWMGTVAMWPLDFDPIGLGGVAVVGLVVLFGLRSIEGISMESAERRSRLVGQLRFAATMQDVRTVMVLQRQLSQEHLRQHPRIRLARATSIRPSTMVFVRRCLQQYLRWSLFRVARLLALVTVAAASTWGVWEGTSALIVPAGLALWIASLDLLEPLAQETDHQDRLRSFARPAGWLLARHLVLPFLTLLGLLCLATVPAVAGAGRSDSDALVALWPFVVVVAGMSIGGAALAVTRQPSVPTASMTMPEVAGLQMLWKALAPPAVAVGAFVPLVIARSSWQDSGSVDRMMNDTSLVTGVVLAAGSWCLLWIRYGGEMRSMFVSAGAGAVGGSDAGRRVPKA